MIWSAVLNPSIRMSWIRKHWDQDYIFQAETKIRDTVRRLCNSWTCLTHFTQDGGIS
jgi:hypothetical protein